METILIVRLSSLGDIVHALPVAAALRRAYPRARIDWLVDARYRHVLDYVPVIDRRLIVAAADRGGVRGVAEGAGAWLDAIRAMRLARYDVALDLQGLLKSAVLARGSGASRVIGFSRSHLREPAARLFYTTVFEPDESGHAVRKNLSMLGALEMKTDTVEFPFEDVKSEVVDLVREEAGASGRYVLLVPGAGWPNKRWPPDRLGALAQVIARRHGVRSAVLWGPSEQELAASVVAHADASAFVAPQTSIGDLIALSRHAMLMVAGDTGPLHLAAAVGTPLVGLFGPTRPVRNGPVSPADVCVSRDDRCRCHHLRRCRLDTPCILDISVDEVGDAVARRLEAAGA